MSQNYTIFTNDIPAIITDNWGEQLSNLEDILLVKLHNTTEVDQLIPLLEDPSTLDKLIIICDEPKGVFERVLAKFKVLKAAGGLVVVDDHLLMIHKNDRWDLPKGKLDPGETALQAAIREVREETGVDTKEGPELNTTYHIYRYKGEFIIKESIWFSLHCDEMTAPQPQADEGIDKVEWVAKSELGTKLMNTYPSIKLLTELHM